MTKSRLPNIKITQQVNEQRNFIRINGESFPNKNKFFSNSVQISP